MRKRTPHLFCRKASMMEPAPAWEITRDALDICKARCKWYGSTINWATTQTAKCKNYWCKWHILMMSDIMASSSKLGFRSNDLARMNKE